MGYIEIEQILSKNACVIGGRKLSPVKGVLIHCTATPGATPERFVKNWNVYHSGGKDIGPHNYFDSPDDNDTVCDKCGGRQCCVNAFCDDTKVIKTMDYYGRPWGCGSGKRGSGNNWYCQIEICEPKGIYYVNGWKYAIKDGYETSVVNYIKDAFEVCAQWAAARLKEFGIKQVNDDTVTSHYEAHAKGIAGNHGDPQGLFALAGLDMDKFRDRVDEILNDRGDELDMTKMEFIESLTPVEAAKLVNKAREYYRSLGNSDYAEEAMSWAKDNGIMAGDGTGNLMPQDFITRQQAMVVLKRYDETKETRL